ncbi:amidohydrolase [Paenibacillus pini]|uniref:Exoenzyme regulatory protein AepA n=1 Tax=Paenibacillus pini JCM 16418 TaxID=1236976 RepID=W7YYF7_9BACL|nr:amidohydrolase [Paenibacillus pini]GAF07479.1 exoenzyme regulatory protein AepA [Paenibacillus pini JCM 16418]
MGICWWNGNIYTMEFEHDKVEAVYTQDGTILESGALEKIKRKYADQIVKYVDLQGKTMFPGFVDSHIHLIGHGETFLKLQLAGLLSRQQLLDRIGEQTRVIPEGEWIIGEGWNENEWEECGMLSKKELDTVAPRHPVMLRRVCRHVMAVNSMALAKAQVTEHVTAPSGGVIEKDPEGKLTGILKEKAQDLILEVIPGVTELYLKTALHAAIEDCWSQGLTGCHTEDLSYYGGSIRVLQAFHSVLHDEGKPFRAHLLVHHLVMQEWYELGRKQIAESPYLEYGAMKIFVDGALGGRTALLSQPYADDPSTCGVAVHSQADLNQWVKQARDYGMSVSAHTIGDKAAEMFLNAIVNHPCPSDKRDRLIHGQILRKALIENMKELPLIVDIQPSFVTSDFPWVLERVGNLKGLYLYAWKTLFNEGIHCAGGSDAPIEKVSPIEAIHAAVTRTRPQKQDKTIYGPEECLSMFQAISLYTLGSAYAIGHEQDRGMIKSGYLADFTVLENDPFQLADADEMLHNSVVMTVINGEIMYELTD